MASTQAHDEAAIARDLDQRGRAELDGVEQGLERLEQREGPPDREGLLESLNELARQLANVGTEVSLFSEVHPSRAVREAAEDVERRLSQVQTRITQSRALYEALGRIEGESLDPMARRNLDLLRQDMRRGGVELDDAERDQVRSLRERIVALEQDFSRNIREDVRTVTLSAGDLDGLPEEYVRAHQQGPEGRVVVSTEYPDYIPFMAYAHSSEARKALMHAYNNRAAPQNLTVLSDLLATRHALAGLLGYASWAAYVTEDKMIGSTERARSFIEQAYEAARESARADLARLIERKRRDFPELDGAQGELGEWEVSYYLERVKAEQLDFDTRTVRPYFPYGAVKQAVMEVSAELFGLTYTPVVDAETWHPAVETFDVTMDGRPVGRISLDMHPREGKFKHAACFTYRMGVGGKQLPHVVLVCNFPDPAGQDEPALMEHREVVTFFHEFGHLVHGLARYEVAWVRLGPVTERDFVEAPSQFLEEWIFDFDVLRRFAKHYETGETIPRELVEHLRAARDFGRGVMVQRQLFFAGLSLALHDRDPEGLDTDAVVREMAARYAPFRLLPDSHFQASFGHLTGYSAIYYTYMWSLVIAKDLHGAFRDGGLMDVPKVKRYRDLILAPGGSKPAAEMVQEFLGRPYSFDAFRDWLAPTETALTH